MSNEVINKEACLLSDNRNVAVRIEELQNTIENKGQYKGFFTVIIRSKD